MTARPAAGPRRLRRAARRLAGAVVMGLVAGCAAAPVALDPALLEQSRLPVLVFETGGRAIPDEPKVPARLSVDLGDRDGFDGPVGIERRGQSSQARYPKPQFGIELRDADGEGLDVDLLGLPPDDDWVLHGPYGDPSLLRNALAYRLARATGRYASRTRFCEVVVDGDYLGVYLLVERIEQGDDRVDVRRLRRGDRGPHAITGGYVFKLDKDPVGGWRSPFPGTNGRHPVYAPHDPGPDDLSEAQRLHLQSAVTAFEETMAGADWDDPDDGYADHLDVGSFVDYFLVTELSRNVDGYRISAYFHKDHIRDGGRIHAGPAWDFDIAFGNADYYGGAETVGWQVDLPLRGRDHPIPAWWPRLVREPQFRATTAERWAALRRGPFHPDSVDAAIDVLLAELAGAPARNFARWPVLGRTVWPNPAPVSSHAAAVADLRAWVRERAAWMDSQLTAAPQGP